MRWQLIAQSRTTGTSYTPNRLKYDAMLRLPPGVCREILDGTICIYRQQISVADG
ncbi:MAG: hypothetical protein ACRD5K_11870 [Candidatus Acidiferrales bacterium]